MRASTLLLAAVAALAASLVPAGTSAVAPLATVVLQGGDVDQKRGKMVPLRAINNSGHPVSVQRAVLVERWKVVRGKEGRWEAVSPLDGLLLRADCRPDPKSRVITTAALQKGCLALAPRSTFTSQPWLGTLGDAQCACERCVPVEPGLYRYRGRLCGKDTPVYGQPFRLR